MDLCLISLSLSFLIYRDETHSWVARPLWRLSDIMNVKHNAWSIVKYWINRIIISFLGNFLDLTFIYNWIVIFFPPNIFYFSQHTLETNSSEIWFFCLTLSLSIFVCWRLKIFRNFFLAIRGFLKQLVEWAKSLKTWACLIYKL